MEATVSKVTLSSRSSSALSAKRPQFSQSGIGDDVEMTSQDADEVDMTSQDADDVEMTSQDADDVDISTPRPTSSRPSRPTTPSATPTSLSTIKTAHQNPQSKLNIDDDASHAFQGVSEEKSSLRQNMARNFPENAARDSPGNFFSYYLDWTGLSDDETESSGSKLCPENEDSATGSESRAGRSRLKSDTRSKSNKDEKREEKEAGDNEEEAVEPMHVKQHFYNQWARLPRSEFNDPDNEAAVSRRPVTSLRMLSSTGSLKSYALMGAIARDQRLPGNNSASLRTGMPWAMNGSGAGGGAAGGLQTTPDNNNNSINTSTRQRQLSATGVAPKGRIRKGLGLSKSAGAVLSATCREEDDNDDDDADDDDSLPPICISCCNGGASGRNGSRNGNSSSYNCCGEKEKAGAGSSISNSRSRKGFFEASDKQTSSSLARQDSGYLSDIALEARSAAAAESGLPINFEVAAGFCQFCPERMDDSDDRVIDRTCKLYGKAETDVCAGEKCDRHGHHSHHHNHCRCEHHHQCGHQSYCRHHCHCHQNDHYHHHDNHNHHHRHCDDIHPYSPSSHHLAAQRHHQLRHRGNDVMPVNKASLLFSDDVDLRDERYRHRFGESRASKLSLMSHQQLYVHDFHHHNPHHHHQQQQQQQQQATNRQTQTTSQNGLQQRSTKTIKLGLSGHNDSKRIISRNATDSSNSNGKSTNLDVSNENVIDVEHRRGHNDESGNGKGDKNGKPANDIPREVTRVQFIDLTEVKSQLQNDSRQKAEDNKETMAKKPDRTKTDDKHHASMNGFETRQLSSPYKAATHSVENSKQTALAKRKKTQIPGPISAERTRDVPKSASYSNLKRNTGLVSGAVPKPDSNWEPLDKRDVPKSASHASGKKRTGIVTSSVPKPNPHWEQMERMKSLVGIPRSASYTDQRRSMKFLRENSGLSSKGGVPQKHVLKSLPGDVSEDAKRTHRVSCNQNSLCNTQNSFGNTGQNSLGNKAQSSLGITQNSISNTNTQNEINTINMSDRIDRTKTVAASSSSSPPSSSLLSPRLNLSPSSSQATTPSATRPSSSPSPRAEATSASSSAAGVGRGLLPRNVRSAAIRKFGLRNAYKRQCQPSSPLTDGLSLCVDGARTSTN